jgi:hypothetical protein
VANAIAEDWKKDEGKRAGIETESLSVLVSCEKNIRTYTNNSWLVVWNMFFIFPFIGINNPN